MSYGDLMKKLFMVSPPNEFKKEFLDETNDIMLQRYRAAAVSLILLEMVMLMVVVVFKKGDIDQVLFRGYICMYLAMIFGMLLYLIAYSRLMKNKLIKGKLENPIIIISTCFVLVWSVGIAVLDQIAYGQIIVYIIAVLAIAEFTYVRPLIMLMVYGACQLILFLVLPRLDLPSGTIFLSLVNSTVFVAMSWVISRMLYKKRVDDFINKKTIEENNHLLSIMNQKLHEANEELEKLSAIDSLSELYNRRKFNEQIELEWQRAQRYGEYLSIIFIDIDMFKAYNDKYGHLNGDECIKKIAAELKRSIRRSVDFIGRYGGEEFVVVLPHADAGQAFELAEQLRKNIQELKIIHEASSVAPYVTISLGINSLIPNESMTVEDLIRGADKALYQAKDNNRNQTVIHGE